MSWHEKQDLNLQEDRFFKGGGGGKTMSKYFLTNKSDYKLIQKFQPTSPEMAKAYMLNNNINLQIKFIDAFNTLSELHTLLACMINDCKSDKVPELDKEDLMLLFMIASQHITITSNNDKEIAELGLQNKINIKDLKEKLIR